MNANIKIRQYVIFIKPRKFGTADIKCFTVINNRYADKMADSVNPDKSAHLGAV